MDVATIATTAAVAGQLGKLALNASNGMLMLSKSVDEPVRNLQSEVKAFGDACNALQSLLNGFLQSQTRLTEAEDEHFFARLQRSISEYESTIEPLDRRVRNVEKARSSLFGKNKLNLKSEEVVRLRQRTESHLLSVQLTLGILNLCVTFSQTMTPTVVAEYDRSKTSLLDNIEFTALRHSISEAQRKRAKLQAISQVNSPYLGQDQKLYQSTAALIADADLILGRATLVLEDGANRSSVGSRSRRGSNATSVTQSPRQCLSKHFEVASSNVASAKTSQLGDKETGWQDHITTQSGTSNPPGGRIESPIYQASMSSQSFTSMPLLSQALRSNTSPSLSSHGPENKQNVFVNHDSVTASGGNINSVSQWIDGLSHPKKTRPSTVPNKPPASLTSELSSTTAPSQSFSNRSWGEQLTSNRTSLTLPSISISSNSLGELLEGDAGRNVKAELAVIDDSDEDDIAVELAKNVLATGKTALEKGNYGVARGYLLEGLSLRQQLPLKLQGAACDMLEVRYGLAMCSLSLDGQIEQEKALLEVLQQEPSSDSQREKLFHVSHILAQLYITSARLSLARQSCNNALRGRRKLLGKEHNDYFSSLALIARICELQNAQIQAQGYMDMIPEPERQNHDFCHLRMESHCEKEAVELADTETPYRPSDLTVRESTTHHLAPQVVFTNTVQYGAALDSNSRTSVREEGIIDVSHSVPTATPIPRKPVADASLLDAILPARDTMSQPALRYSDLVQISQSDPAPAKTPAISPDHSSLSVARVQSYADVPLPNPGNDHLGFCKGACQLQNGDRKAMKKVKEYNNLRTSVYWLRCSASKCDFATEIDVSLIWTWTKVLRLKESHGIAYRWSFLGKSHVRQTKVQPHQAMYKCLFCVFLGLHAPVIQGTDLYFDHIAQKHRGSSISQVVLYKTNCVTDRVCTDEEDFDINLYPLISAEHETANEGSRVESKLDPLHNLDPQQPPTKQDSPISPMNPRSLHMR
jgi:hypothetical protein